MDVPNHSLSPQMTIKWPPIEFNWLEITPNNPQMSIEITVPSF